MRPLSPAIAWFVSLTLVCIAGPYVLHVAPRTPRQRMLVALTIAFLTWVLPMMVSLRSL